MAGEIDGCLSYNIIIPSLQVDAFKDTLASIKDLATHIPSDRSPVGSTHIKPIVGHCLHKLEKSLSRAKIGGFNLVECAVQLLTLFDTFDKLGISENQKQAAVAWTPVSSKASAWANVSDCRAYFLKEFLSYGFGANCLTFVERMGHGLSYAGGIEDRMQSKSALTDIHQLCKDGQVYSTRVLEKVRDNIKEKKVRKESQRVAERQDDQEDEESSDNDSPVPTQESPETSTGTEVLLDKLNEEITAANRDSAIITLFGGSQVERDQALKMFSEKAKLKESFSPKFQDASNCDLYTKCHYFAPKCIPTKQFLVISRQGKHESALESWIDSKADYGQSFAFCQICYALQVHNMSNIEIELADDQPDNEQIRVDKDKIIKLALPKATKENSIYKIALGKRFISKLVYVSSQLNRGSEVCDAEVRGSHFNSMLHSCAHAFSESIRSLNGRSIFAIDESKKEPRCIHVVSLITHWGRENGGVPVFNQTMCERLLECTVKGRPVYVTCVTIGNLPKTELHQNGRVISPPKIDGVDGMSSLALVDAECIRSQSCNLPVDIVIGHDRFTGPAAVTVARRLQATSVLILHVPTIHVAIVKDEWETKYEEIHSTLKRTSSLADVIVSSGVAGMDTPNPNLVLYPGLPLKSSCDSPVGSAGIPHQVAFVGRVDDTNKGAPIVKSLSQTFGDKLAVLQIGGSPNEELIKGRTTHPIYSIPYLENEQKYLEALRNCRCLVMPSIVDAFGLVVADAIANFIPVVVAGRTGAGNYLKALRKIADDASNGTESEEFRKLFPRENENMRKLEKKNLEELGEFLGNSVVEMDIISRDSVSEATVNEFKVHIDWFLDNPAKTNAALEDLRKVWPSDEVVFADQLHKWLPVDECEQ